MHTSCTLATTIGNSYWVTIIDKIWFGETCQKRFCQGLLLLHGWCWWHPSRFLLWIPTYNCISQCTLANYFRTVIPTALQNLKLDLETTKNSSVRACSCYMGGVDGTVPGFLWWIPTDYCTSQCTLANYFSTVIATELQYTRLDLETPKNSSVRAYSC